MVGVLFYIARYKMLLIVQFVHCNAQVFLRYLTMNITQHIMLKKLLIPLALLLFNYGGAQTICDSVSIAPDTFYITQGTDTVVFDTLTFTGQSDISYSTCYFHFPDTSYITINEIAVSNGISGPFTFTKWDGYKIIYKNPTIPPGTIVNGFYKVYHNAIPNPAIDCSLPVTFIINSVTEIPQHNAVQDITIYPNPATDLISINLPSNYSNPQLSIYNLTGQLLSQKPITSTQIPITELRNGMYIFVIESGDKVVGRQRVVVNR